MRGTPRQTNKALSAPVLLMGAERSLVLISSLFWGWAFLGVLPHWPMIIVAALFLITLYLLRFAAKSDPQAVAVFRANSRFLIQSRFYNARGYANHVVTVRKLQTVPTKLFARF